MSIIPFNISWNFGHFDEGNVGDRIIEGVEVPDEEFITILQNVQLNLTSYIDNKVVFLFPIYISSDRSRRFISYQPVYYNINDIRNGLQLVGAIESFYKADIPEIDVQLENDILETGRLRRRGEYEISPEGDILGLRRSFFLRDFAYGIDSIIMIRPGIYQIKLTHMLLG